MDRTNIQLGGLQSMFGLHASRHLHTHAVACYWWQLLSAFAALQNFEPRTQGELGFRELRGGGTGPARIYRG